MGAQAMMPGTAAHDVYRRRCPEARHDRLVQSSRSLAALHLTLRSTTYCPRFLATTADIRVLDSQSSLEKLPRNTIKVAPVPKYMFKDVHTTRRKARISYLYTQATCHLSQRGVCGHRDIAGTQ
ncbi:hypothetical protein V5799_013055 [Amblyomma americanum]|uniref:Uncharacterized protein n=1 Tax=Amblyomma americanum TaxID=6943 RepID=A0AAQ4E722_AMBAM